MSITNKRSEQVSGRDEEKPAIAWHDDERIQMYVAAGHDLVQHTPLGHQLECFRDNVRIQGMPSTHPPGDWGYGNGTAYHRARETALRLWDAERFTRGTIATLWAYCHPTAVTLDGLPGGRGRVFCTYPLTPLGQLARRSVKGADACPLEGPRLLGPRDCECSGRDCSCWARPTLLRRLYAEFVESKGDQRDVWMAIHRQAKERLEWAVSAWNTTQGAEDERRLERQELRRAAGKRLAVTSSSSES